MNIIESLDAPGFQDYLKKYENTICGRHPIAVLLNVRHQHTHSKFKQVSPHLCVIAGSERAADEESSPVQYEVHKLQAVQSVSPFERLVGELRGGSARNQLTQSLS